MVTNLKANIVEKDNKIKDLRDFVDSLKTQFAEQEEDIMEKDQEIV